MSAKVKVVGIYGPNPGTEKDVSQQRYSTTDQPDPGLSYPNNIPESGKTNYSYWIHTGLCIMPSTGSNDKYTQVSNFRWKNPGFRSNWNLKSGKVLVALKNGSGIDHGCPRDKYDQARGIEGETGYSILHPTYGHAYYRDDGKCEDADNYVKSPLVFDTQKYTPKPNEYTTKFVVHQMELEPDTEFGEKGALTCDFLWSEI